MDMWRVTTFAIVCVATVVTSGCVRTSEGFPVAESPAGAASTPTPPGSFSPTTATAEPDPGVLPTLQVPVPAGTVTCPLPPDPGATVETVVSDPEAPKITVGLPAGWNVTRGSGDVAATMTGPEAMTATVTIARTTLDPAEAFRDYTDRIMAAAAVSTVSVLPAELCEYSGQKLMGAWSDTPENAVEFRDRLVHIWTNTANFMVSVHVEAPTGVDALDAAGARLTGDVKVEIP
jgi:hypothetical protein